MIEIRKAKKEYKCDYTGETIKVGEEYKRLNIRGVMVFHFKKHISDTTIKEWTKECYNIPPSWFFEKGSKSKRHC